MISHLGVPVNRSGYAAIHSPADVPHVVAHDAARNDNRNAWNCGPNSSYVRVSQAILEDIVSLASFVGYFLFFWRLYASNNHFLAAKILDLFLGFKARTFANCQHGND